MGAGVKYEYGPVNVPGCSPLETEEKIGVLYIFPPLFVQGPKSQSLLLVGLLRENCGSF